MKSILLLQLLCISFFCVGQQRELDSLLAELKKNNIEDTARLQMLLNVTRIYSNINATEGVKTGLEAVKLAKKHTAKNKLAAAYTFLGQNYQTLGKDSLALDLCRQSLSIYKQIKDSLGIASAYQTMGISYFNFSDYYTAIKYQQAALDIVKKLKIRKKEADMLNSLGVNFKYLGDYPKALQYLQDAITIWNETGQQVLTGYAFTNIGLVYKNMSMYEKALEYYNKALAIHKAAGNTTSIADCLGNIATVYDLQGNAVKALNYLRNQLQLSKTASYDYGVRSAEANLGISYANGENYDSALYYLLPAYEKFKAHNDASNAGLMLSYLSYSITNATNATLNKFNIDAKDKFNKALKLQMQGIDFFLKTGNKTLLAEAYGNLSNIYEAKKDYVKALEAYKEYFNYSDSLLNSDKKQQITRLEMQYQFKNKEDSARVIADKQNALAVAEIQKQRIIKNSAMGGAGFLVIAGIGGFAFYKRNRDVKAKKNEAELRVQITDTEMKALRAQMNPHFIFNSLNSIADYIDKNQTQTASTFTTKFARLMRMVLENSEHAAISLEEDLKALELYIQLERARLNNKFDYSIIVDENIDQENTLVPPLILQPFVENSIWHGIAKKEGRGNINICIKQENGMINCIVEDDGAGISTHEINHNKKSLGMKITRERIDVINITKKSNASVGIFQRPTGVRAEVKLPLELSF